jgi:predicted PurR-regulated permease PerM
VTDKTLEPQEDAENPGPGRGCPTVTITTVATPARVVLLVVASVLASLAAVIVVTRLWSVISVCVVSVVLACCLEPGVERLVRRGVRRPLAAGVVLGGVVLAIGAMAGAVGAAVTSQALDLLNQAPELAAKINDVGGEYGLSLDGGQVVDYVSTAGSILLGRTWGAVLALVTSLLIVYFCLADGPHLRRTLCSVLPPARQEVVLTVWEVAIDRAGRYLSTRVVLAVVSSIFTWATLEILGIPHAIALGVWVGVMSQLIPILGTYLAMVLPLLVALADGDMKALVILAIVLTVYQQVENFVLAPRISGRALNVHPVVAFLGVLAGSSLLGVAGAVIALPVIATASAVVSTYLRRHELVSARLLDNHEDSTPGR